MATEQGFSNQKKKGKANFKTVHNVGSDSFATVSISKSLYDISPSDRPILSVTDVIGSDGQISAWKIEITGHLASVGNVFRISTNSLKNFEFEIVEVIDANNFNILPISNVKPTTSDSGRVLGWITNKSSDQGTSSNILGEVVLSNSTTTPLAGGATFTGPSFEVLPWAVVNVNLISDQISATNGVKVQFSPDGTNWDHTHQTSYTAAGSGIGIIFNVEFKFARVVYTNGATPQTYFRLQTIVKANPVKQSLYTIAQTVTGNMFAELGKNVIIGETTAGGGSYVAVKVNPSGALTVENTPSSLVPSFQEILNLTNVAQTFTAPTGAKWCKIQADTTNTAVIRVKIGGTATTTSGFQFAAGRSEDFNAVGNISVICETAATNQKICVQFGV